MTTPAEAIPVANAVPVSPSAPTSALQAKNPKDDFFQPISGTQYLGRFFIVFIGHLDTFLTITVVASLPAVVGYHWMLDGHWGSSWIFYYFLLPLTRLMANGAAVTATALIYLLDQQQIPWKKAIEIAYQKKVVNRWILQSLYTQLSFLMAPLGFFAFSPQLLLLEPQSTLVGSMFSSAQLIFRRPWTFVTTLFFTYGLTPLLCWVLERFISIFVPLLTSSSSSPEGEEGEGIDTDPWAEGRHEVQQIVALPLVSCLWTILYLNICIQRRPGLTREALAHELEVQLPPTVVARVH